MSFEKLFLENIPAMLVLDIIPKLVLDNIPSQTSSFSYLTSFWIELNWIDRQKKTRQLFF